MARSQRTLEPELGVIFHAARQDFQMDDRPAVSRGFKAGNLAHGRRLLAPCHQECPDLNFFRVAGLIQKGPDATAAVIVVEVSGNVYAMHQSSFRSGVSRAVYRSSAPGFVRSGPRAVRSMFSSASSASHRHTMKCGRPNVGITGKARRSAIVGV